MSNSLRVLRGLRFGAFEIDLEAGELRKNGLRVKLQDQPFRILVVMAHRSRRIISREELYSQLSTHPAYDFKHGLNNAVQKIREALGDSPDNARFIETVSNRGYRFLSDVEFIYEHDSSEYNPFPSAGDQFSTTVDDIRRRLLAATSLRDLTEVKYHINALISQYPEHPRRHEALMLRDQITKAWFMTKSNGFAGFNRTPLGESLPSTPKTSRDTLFWALFTILLVVGLLSPLVFDVLPLAGRPILATTALLAVLMFQLAPFVMLAIMRRLTTFWKIFLTFVIALIIFSSFYLWQQATG